MTRRIVEVARFPAKVSVAQGQILIRRTEEGETAELRVPAEDLGLLILDHPQTSVTLPALARIVQHGGVVVVCGDNHLPAGLLLPVAEHTETVLRIKDQIAASLPLTKRLWQQVVKAKIRAQALNLPAGVAQEKLLRLAGRVLSGDSANHEAQAARVYWKAWAPPDSGFARDPEGGGLNPLLNFGYAVVRAAVARALVAAGFCTALGLHHHLRSNAFCLADDIMEPLRPLVDARVSTLNARGEDNVTPVSKRELYQLLLDPVLLDGQRLPLLDSTHRTAASLAACLRRERDALLLPEAGR